MSTKQQEQKEKIAAEESKQEEIKPESGQHSEEDLVLAEPPSQDKLIEELKAELVAAEQKAQENWDRALRVQAEMENLKRRTQKDLEDTHKYALTGFAKDLLTVLDSLELGLQAATGESEEVKKFREGSELTIKQFETVFAKYNVVTINPLGEPFNADQHQAVVMQEVENAVPNSVVSVFQKGYTMNGRLLRPAMVVVAKAAEKPVSPENSKNSPDDKPKA